VTYFHHSARFWQGRKPITPSAAGPVVFRLFRFGRLFLPWPARPGSGRSAGSCLNASQLQPKASQARAGGRSRPAPSRGTTIRDVNCFNGNGHLLPGPQLNRHLLNGVKAPAVDSAEIKDCLHQRVLTSAFHDSHVSKVDTRTHLATETDA